jgi:ribose transport system substrate-binding protein
VAVLLVFCLLLAACGGDDGAEGAAAAGEAAPEGGGEAGGQEVPEEVRSHEFEWGTFELADRVVERLESGDAMRIIVNNQGTGIPVFGAQQRQGMEEACERNADRLPVECRYTGPATTDFPAQRAELETLLNSGQADCLVLQTGEPGAFNDLVDAYVDAGIPVFTNNGDVPNSKRFAFYALNEVDAARRNAEATAAVMRDRDIEPSVIAMGSGAPTAPWAQERLEGFAEGMAAEFPAAEFFNQPGNALGTGDDFTTEQVVSSVGPFLAGNPQVDFFFHTDQGVEGVGQVIKNAGRTGEVWTSGFNVSAPILELMESGEILVTIDQGFDRQAAAGVDACVDYLTNGEVPDEPLQYLDPIIVTADGIDGTMTVQESRERLEAAE